jgi:hypothetical protein
MLRRTVLQWLAAAAGTIPFPALRAWAQTSNFPGKYRTTLRDLAAAVLPSELGRTGTDQVADKFEQWVREYRPGAFLEPGYGFPRLRPKAASPAANYVRQLATLREPLTVAQVEAAIEKANIKDLPRSPDGKHVISDLMAFYYHGSDASDLCYRAAIRREECRGLQGSDNPPPPLQGTA